MTGVARRGRPRLTEGQRATQRAEVLAGAMDSIRRRGAEVSLQEIAHDSGVSKPVLYGHFGDRLGLADAIAVVMADDVTDTAMDEVERLSEPGGEIHFDAAVRAIVASLIDVVEQEPAIYGFLIRTIRAGERGFFDNALVDVIRLRGGRLVELANPRIDRDVREVLVDGAFGFLLFSIESWKATGAPGREELVEMLTDAVVAGFASAAGEP